MNKTLSALTALILALAMATPAFATFADHFDETDDIGQNKVPHSGNPKTLVGFVDIASGSYTPDWTRWRTFFTSTDSCSSFNGYYTTASLGSYSPQPVVTGPYHAASCPVALTNGYCYIARGDISSLASALDFIAAVVGQMKAAGVDFTQFDTYGAGGKVADGWLDGMILVINAYFTGIAVPVAGFRNITVDGIRIGSLALVPANESTSIALHEFGHTVGFADMYDEDGSSSGAVFTLMGGIYPDRPLMFDAYDRYKIGWANVIDVATSSEVTIRPTIETGDVVRVGGKKEFFLIESRMQTSCYDPISGANANDPRLAIYHVDENVPPGILANVGLPMLNSDEYIPRVRNVEADRRFDILHGRDNGDYADLFTTGDTLLPKENGGPFGPDNLYESTNYYGGAVSKIYLSRIAKDGQNYTVDIGIGAPYAPPVPAPAQSSGGCSTVPGAPVDPLDAAMLIVPLMLIVAARKKIHHRDTETQRNSG